MDDLFLVDMDLFKPIYMLGALSLELLFKGAIVAREPTAINEKGRADWEPRGGHALTELAKRAQVPNLDSDLLAKLERFITRKARYPSDRETFYEPPNLENFAGTHTATVLNSIEAMYDAARTYIKATLPEAQS